MSILLAAIQRLIITLLALLYAIPILILTTILLVVVFVGIVPELIEVIGSW